MLGAQTLLGRSSQVILDWLQEVDSSPDGLNTLLENLLILEKQSKKDKGEVDSQEFIGHWQLTYISQKNTAQGPSGKNATGKVLPPWIHIQLSFEQPQSASLTSNQGNIRNQVKLGFITLELSGPWMYLPQRRIMAFDFLYLEISSFGKVLLDISVRGGNSTEKKFWSQSLKEQAFFRFFWTSPEGIAARGKGGGIALWRRIPDTNS